MIDLQEAKDWLRVDHDEDDNLIKSLIYSAEQYLKNATGKEFSSENQLAKQFCLFLIADWYDNRQFTGEKVGEKVKYILQSMLAQLQYGGEEDAVQSETTL